MQVRMQGVNRSKAFHAHEYVWNRDGILKSRTDRSWTEEEEMQNKDLIHRMIEDESE